MGTSDAAVRSLVRPDQGVLSQLMWISLFAVATALGARVEIPHQPVPYTLQTMIVLLSGAFLGSRNGAVSQMLYLLSGALGAPVFSAGSFGIAALLGPTGGYLLAFPAAAAVVGYLIRRRRTLVWTLISMATGLVLIFAFGTIQLYAVAIRNLGDAILGGFLIFSWWDALKLGAAAMTYYEIAKRWPYLPR